MILPLRIALFLLALGFTYFFGETLEGFLLEIVRFLVPVDTSNFFIFNVLHLIVTVIPLLLFGLIASISFLGEKNLKVRLWQWVWSIVTGLIFFRMVQVWWILRGGIGDETESWTESLTVFQLYFLEKLFPYLILGAAAGLTASLIERETNKIKTYAVFSVAASFLWLLITKKIQELNGPAQIGGAFLITSFSAFLIGFSVQKLREF